MKPAFGKNFHRLFPRSLGKWFLILLPIPLLWWVFQQVPISQMFDMMRGLDLARVGYWLALNFGLLILMNGRWWLILRVLGHPVAFPALARYRLASFAVSYFTPGPQFGGEPLQVIALHKYHQVPAAIGAASVSLHRLLELIANFTFLVFGVALTLSGTSNPGQWRGAGLVISLALLTFPLAYLILMLVGRKPLTVLTTRLPGSLASTRFVRSIHQVEWQMSRFCVEQPITVLVASLVSLAVWVGLVAEYWFLTWILGLHLSFIQAVSALVAARLALLTPLPGGLGVMEASQILAYQTIGLQATFGATIALLIRMRDLIFGCFGLLSVVSLLKWPPWYPVRKSLARSSNEKDGV